MEFRTEKKATNTKGKKKKKSKAHNSSIDNDQKKIQFSRQNVMNR